jgi:hypothetical protein
MSTEKAHLESQERDLTHDFKDIDKRYSAQLVQVKVGQFYDEVRAPCSSLR